MVIATEKSKKNYLLKYKKTVKKNSSKIHKIRVIQILGRKDERNTAGQRGKVGGSGEARWAAR